jgi:hypothetical protein
MELLGPLLIGLPTIFVAAFLAMMLENLRERLRTRRWVMRTLRALAAKTEPGTPGNLQRIEEAVDRWLAAESPADMDEQTWLHAHFFVLSTMPDLTPVVRSEAAIAVPAEVFAAVSELEDAIIVLMKLESYVNDMFARDVSPLWCARRAPLTGPDRRLVSWYRTMVVSYRERFAQLPPILERFQAAVSG